MRRTAMNAIRKMMVAGALAGTTLLGGAMGATLIGTASAQTTSTTAAATATDSSQGAHQANGITETPLTGDDLAKATAAAEDAVPGATVDRAETDADGAAYEVHITK